MKLVIGFVDLDEWSPGINYVKHPQSCPVKILHLYKPFLSSFNYKNCFIHYICKFLKPNSLQDLWDRRLVNKFFKELKFMLVVQAPTMETVL